MIPMPHLATLARAAVASALLMSGLAQSQSLQYDATTLPVTLAPFSGFALGQDGRVVGWTNTVAFDWINGTLQTYDVLASVPGGYDFLDLQSAYIGPNGNAVFSVGTSSFVADGGLGYTGYTFVASGGTLTPRSNGNDFVVLGNTSGSTAGVAFTGSGINLSFINYVENGITGQRSNLTAIQIDDLNEANQALLLVERQVPIENSPDPQNPEFNLFSAYEVWDAGRLTQVAIESSEGSVAAFDLSDAGHVLYESFNFDAVKASAFVWLDGVASEVFGDLSFGGIASGAVNANGDVAAVLTTDDFTSTRAFVSLNGQSYELVVTGRTITEILGLTDNGSVLAKTSGTGGPLLQLLNPVPEPSTYALVALGLAGAVVVARRRRA